MVICDMGYYIARRNTESGKFELNMDKGKPTEYRTEHDAIDMYKISLSLEGSNNVLLLESVVLDVNLTVERWVRNSDDVPSHTKNSADFLKIIGAL